MNRALALLLFAPIAFCQTALTKAASRFAPEVTWNARSTVRGDFTCSGHPKQAILGVDRKRPVVVVAIFVNGMNNRPLVLEFSQRPEYARIEAETLDYELDYELPGFQRSATCKGLVVSDGEIDPTHLYWNHHTDEFGMWSN